MAGSPPMPLGLQQLLPLDFVKVKERRSFLSRKFVVTTDGGDRIFTVREDDSGMVLLHGGKDRQFNMDFFDGNEQHVMSLRRPYCFLGMSKMEVIILGETASVVRQEATFLKPVISINDAHDVQVMRVKGHEALTGDVKYELLSVEKSPIGSINRKVKWREPDQYHVTFPADLDVRYKLTVIATSILIDSLYHR